MACGDGGVCVTCFVSEGTNRHVWRARLCGCLLLRRCAGSSYGPVQHTVAREHAQRHRDTAASFARVSARSARGGSDSDSDADGVSWPRDAGDDKHPQQPAPPHRRTRVASAQRSPRVAGIANRDLSAPRTLVSPTAVHGGRRPQQRGSTRSVASVPYVRPASQISPHVAHDTLRNSEFAATVAVADPVALAVRSPRQSPAHRTGRQTQAWTEYS
eukprot:m.396613 g.396613  ORF g.396613 m.396613 type:complete len:215 (-) comp21112_c0_seq2:68-712(-)